MVTFDQIPVTTRAPLSYAEIGVSRSQNLFALKPLVGLLIGQRTSSGTALALSFNRVTSDAQGQVLFGAGSQLHEMCIAWFKNNKSTALYCIPVDDAAGSAAETRTITLTGPATAAGTFAQYFGGKRVAVPVAAGDTAATVVGNLAAAAALVPDLPYTVGGLIGAVQTFVSKNKGTLGADIDLRHSYGANESLPAGLTVAYAVGTAGSGVVSYSTLAIFGLVAQTQFDIIAIGANDTTNYAYVTSELLDRWSPLRNVEGGVFIAFRGDLSASLTRGALLNSPYGHTLPVKNAPAMTWNIAAGLAASAAFAGGQDPARPFHTVPIYGVVPPVVTDRFTLAEQEQLLRAGMSTYIVDPDGTVRIQRLITNSQTNAGGAADSTYLDANTWMTLSFLRYNWRQRMITKYPRHKLSDDDVAFADGQPIMTPERGRAEAVAWFAGMEALGLVEGREQFKADLVVQRNGSDRNRMDWLLPVNLVNQLEVAAARIEFTL